MDQTMKQYAPKLNFVYHHFQAVPGHQHAFALGWAAEAAGAQGKFWEMHDRLYQRQFALEDSSLAEYAADLGLDVERFTQELTQGTHAPRVREDFRSGVSSGVNGTPTFFINGARHDGSYDAETLLAALERAAKGK